MCDKYADFWQVTGDALDYTCAALGLELAPNSRDRLMGFARHLTLDAWGFADMNAGLPNTHRLTMNIWTGPNRPPSPRDMAGLVHYKLITQEFASFSSPHLHPDGDVLRGIDPTGLHVTLRTIR